MEDMEKQLPPEIVAEIQHALAEGVYLSLDRNYQGEGRIKVTGIHWNPGDPNALASVIAEEVKDGEEMPLSLDGQEFMVRRALIRDGAIDLNDVRRQAEAEIVRAQNIVLRHLQDCDGVPVKEVLQNLADEGIRSDATSSEALMRLLIAHDVDLDEQRFLRIHSTR